MTREEAKEVFLNRGFIDGIYNGDKWREACVVISKWLEQEPTTRNCFGCKYAKDNHNAGTEECHLCMWENQYTPTTKNDIRDNRVKNELNRVKDELEPTTKNDLGVEYISRADVNQVIEDYMDEQYHVLSDRTRERAFGAKVVKARINELPSVTPQEPRKGHWIFVDKAHEHAHCSNCDYGDVDLLDGRPHNYCPKCGSDNREVEE